MSRKKAQVDLDAALRGCLQSPAEHLALTLRVLVLQPCVGGKAAFDEVVRPERGKTSARIPSLSHPSPTPPSTPPPMFRSPSKLLPSRSASTINLRSWCLLQACKSETPEDTAPVACCRVGRGVGEARGGEGAGVWHTRLSMYLVQRYMHCTTGMANQPERRCLDTYMAASYLQAQIRSKWVL